MKTSLLWRQARLWILARAVYSVILVAAVSSPDLREANNVWHAQPAVILLCIALGVIDIWRRGERLLLANLGVGPAQLGWVLASPPLAAEALVVIAGSI